MTKETLKKLIEVEFERCKTISQFKDEVFRLIDLYESEQNIITQKTIIPLVYGEPDEVPYGSICGCNPANGGSGVCGCIMGNKMVPNPKKYGYPKTNISTTTNI